MLLLQDNIDILEAYVKSWISGALDRAVIRGSAAFTLVLHHVSSFIFLSGASDDLSLQNKLVKTLLRDYSQKQNHEVSKLSIAHIRLQSHFRKSWASVWLTWLKLHYNKKILNVGSIMHNYWDIWDSLWLTGYSHHPTCIQISLLIAFWQLGHTHMECLRNCILYRINAQKKISFTALAFSF